MSAKDDNSNTMLTDAIPEQICSTCYGGNVYRLKWVNLNTKEISLKTGGTEGLCEWCEDCEDTTEICTHSNYLKHQQIDWNEKSPENDDEPSCEKCGSGNIEYAFTLHNRNNTPVLKCNDCQHLFEASLR